MLILRTCFELETGYFLILTHQIERLLAYLGARRQAPDTMAHYILPVKQRLVPRQSLYNLIWL